MDILGIGDNTIDIYIDEGICFPGGNAVNVAVMTRRLGANSSYIGCIGKDKYGNLIKTSLEKENVDISFLKTVNGDTPWSIVKHTNSDRYFHSSSPGVRGKYDITNNMIDFISNHKLAHTSIYSDLENYLDIIRKNIEILSFDFSDKFQNYDLYEYCKYMDIVFLSGAKLKKDQVDYYLNKVIDYGVKIVIMTLGTKGSICLYNNNYYHQSKIDCEVIDTLGAGDGYISAFLLSYLNKDNINTSLNKSAFYAKMVCGYMGGYGHKTKYPLS